MNSFSPIKVVTLCSGYDAQCLAIERLNRNYPGFDYELVAWAEIDKYAIQAHNSLFPQYKDRNMGDITSCDWSKITENIDLLTYSTPCTSISSAGKQEGLKKDSGTASSIIWSVLNAIDTLKPKYLLMENVKALVSSKFIGDFHEWQLELVKRGYANFAKVLNSRDFGIPQNRERIFMVSILDENASYHFPEPFPLDKRLKDVLEEEVDEKYYLSKKLVNYVFSNGGKNDNIKGAIGVHEKEDDISNTITAQYWKTPRQGNYIKEPIACAMRGREVQCLTPKRTEYGKKVRKEYESGKLKESRHNMQQFEPRTDGVCNTITSVQKDNLIVEPNIIQKERGFNKGGVHEISPTISANSWECNNFLIEPKILSYTRDSNGKVVDRHLKDVANTIHGATGRGGNTDSFVVEPSIVIGSAQKHAYVGSVEGISPCINAACGMGGGQTPMVADKQMFRIRKLTERECFRLMDVDDADIDKIQAAGISRSQRYKLAGNSICVGVLFHIFRKLFIDTSCESKQLSIF